MTQETTASAYLHDCGDPRKGDWMQTATGRAFWPMDPRPEEVFIEDIAHALANTCRYGGHCREFYSVAQHSVLVSQALPKHFRLWGLLHDASEAYVADVPRPIKRFLPDYREAETVVMNAIADKFGLSREMPLEVKRMDNAMLATEAGQLMEAPPGKWTLPEPALDIVIRPWVPRVAKLAFLNEFRSLNKENGEAA